MALKSYIGRTNVSPASLSNLSGITRGAQAVSQTLLDGVGVAKTIGDVAYKEGAVMREKEGLAAGAEVEIIKDPQTGQYKLPEDMGGNFSIYDQAYQKSVLTKYSANLQTDITNTLQKMSIDNFMDVGKFEAVSGGYIKGTLEGVDPRVRNQVASFAAKQQSQLAAGIGNRVARQQRQNSAAASSAVIKQSAGSALSAAMAVDSGDVFKHPEVIRHLDLHTKNVAEAVGGLFINQETANLQRAALARKIISVSSTSRFLKLDKVERAKALAEVIANKGKFIDENPGLKSLTIDERNNTATLLRTLNTGLNGVDTAVDEATKERLSNLLLERAMDGLPPETANIITELKKDPNVKPSILLSGANALTVLQNRAAVASRREQEKKRAEIEAQVTRDGILNVLNVKDPTVVAQWNSMTKILKIEDNLVSQKSLAVALYNNSQRYARAVTDGERHELNKAKLDILLKRITDPEQKKRIERLKENPDLSGNLVSFVSWLRNDELREEDRLSRLIDQQAANQSYESAIQSSMKLLKLMNADEYNRVQAILNNKNAPINKTKNLRQKYLFVNREVTSIRTRDGYKAKQNRFDAAIADAKVLADQLNMDISKSLAQAVDGLVSPQEALTQVERLVSNLRSVYKARQQQAIKERPYHSAIANGINVTPSRSNAAFSESIGLRKIEIRQSQINGGDYSYQEALNPDDPGVWASLGLFKAGIPQRFIDVMNGVNSINDTEKVARAREMFQFLNNSKNEASIHLKAQLDGETLGRLRAVSELGGDDLASYQDMLKAKAEGREPVSHTNKNLLPDDFEAVRDNGTFKTDNQLREEFLKKFKDLHERFATGTTDTGYAPFMGMYASKELKDKARATTISSAPPAFVDDLYKGVMSRLHHYSKAYSDKDEAFEQAMKDTMQSMLGRGGENSWGLTKLMGRKPGIEKRGAFSLDKDVPEKFFRVPSPNDAEGIDWIYDEVKNQINTQIKKSDLGEHKITFGQDKGSVFLIHTGERSELNTPLYHVGMYNSNGDVLHMKLFRADNKPVTIDLGFEHQRRTSNATDALIAEKIANDAYANRMTEGFQAQEKRRAETLAGKPPSKRPSRDPNQGLADVSGDY